MQHVTIGDGLTKQWYRQGAEPHTSKLILEVLEVMRSS